MLSIQDHLSDRGIDKWIAELGCTNAPVPGQNVSVAPRAKKWFGQEFGVMAAGGGGQLIIPESYSSLLVEGS